MRSSEGARGSEGEERGRKKAKEGRGKPAYVSVPKTVEAFQGAVASPKRKSCNLQAGRREK